MSLQSYNNKREASPEGNPEPRNFPFGGEEENM